MSLTHRMRKGMVPVALAGFLAGVALISAQTKPSTAKPANVSATRERIVQYIRDRFGVPTNVKLSVGPFRDSFDPAFEEATVDIVDGQQKKDQNILVSKDGHYLIVGNLYALSADPKREIVQRVREQFKLAATMVVTIGTFRKSNLPDFLETTLTFEDGSGKKQTQNFYVSKDSRSFVLGSVFNFKTEARRDVLRAINTQNQPFEGSAKATVTVVEYADLECPTCARLHEFLQNDVMPKYGDKVKIIFKEFPLVQIHDWALIAAVACQCAYQINPNPSAFIAYRSLIFKNQSLVNATNARDMMLSLASQVGIDSLKLAGCVDSKASLPRVEQGLNEGKQLGVNQTPTSYINGRIMVGLPSPEVFYQAIDEALHAPK